jgi:hypothetical protein
MSIFASNSTGCSTVSHREFEHLYHMSHSNTYVRGAKGIHTRSDGAEFVTPLLCVPPDPLSMQYLLDFLDQFGKAHLLSFLMQIGETPYQSLDLCTVS